MSALSYVLITPARNEEQYLERTIESVAAQTVLPMKWVLVSDGSTDRTDNIMTEHASRHNWIHFLRMPEHVDRQFAAKVRCFTAGYEIVKSSPFHIIGNLDADLSFEVDYMEFLLDKFSRDPELGVAGTPFVEDTSGPYDYRFTNIEHVSGACQLFRRECFEEIGGYKPIKGGGIDWVAVTTARMMGWKTRTFTEKTIHHHRKIGTGKGNSLNALFRQGQKDFYLGNHPVWELFRTIYQMKSKPYGISGLAIFAGYITASLVKSERPVPKDLIQFNRSEQLRRLGDKFRLRGSGSIPPGSEKGSGK